MELMQCNAITDWFNEQLTYSKVYMAMECSLLSCAVLVRYKQENKSSMATIINILQLMDTVIASDQCIN